MGKLTQDAEVSVASESTETNATEQEALDQEEVMAQVRVELRQLARDTRDLVDARKTALERLAEDTEAQEIDNGASDLVITGVIIAIGAATAGIGGVITASVASAATGAAKEFIKSATKDIIDTQLNAQLTSAVGKYTADWDGGGSADPRKAFFRGPADAMHLSKGAIDREIMSSSNVDLVMKDTDPVGLICELQDATRANIETATSTQSNKSLVEWLNLLARADLGEADGGTDVGNAGIEGETELEKLRRVFLAAAPRGLVRMKVRADDTDGNVDVIETKIAGINDELVGQIGSIKEPIGELGMTLYIYGDTYAHIPGETGYIEIGKNPTGGYFTEGSPMGKSWLGYYGLDQRTPQDPDGSLVIFVGGEAKGAQRLIDEYIGEQCFGELGWENNVLHRTDGQPQHG